MDEKFGLGKCGLLHLEWISNGVLLDGMGLRTVSQVGTRWR